MTTRNGDIARISQNSWLLRSQAASTHYHRSPHAIIMVIMLVTITMIVIVVITSAAIKTLITSIHRDDDTPLDFRVTLWSF